MRGIQPPFFWKAKRFFGILDEGAAAHHIAVCKDYVRDIIHRRRQSQDFEQRNDLLSLYIAHAKKSGLDYMAEDDYLMDVCFNFMLAGRDTTSCTLTNLIKLVYSTEGVRERVLQELDVKLPNDKQMTWDDVQCLPFANGVFNEAIRMYPPVPVDFRMTNKDETLPSGLKVARGDRVGFPIYAMGRDPTFAPFFFSLFQPFVR